MAADYCCPTCDVTLEASSTEVRCWRCGWEVRDVDHPRRFVDLVDAIRDAGA
jgi:anaerobic ribonucleoside-triphosphate reductase